MRCGVWTAECLIRSGASGISYERTCPETRQNGGALDRARGGRVPAHDPDSNLCPDRARETAGGRAPWAAGAGARESAERGDGVGAVTVAALYVETDGCYFGLPDVDPWDIERDAKT